MINPVLIHEVHDMWPATLVEIGGMSKKHPFVKLLQIAENSAYKHSDAVVSILPNTEEYMISHGLQRGKYFYIPNGIVASDWSAAEDLPVGLRVKLQQLHDDGKFVVGYFGGHAISNALDTLLDASKLLQNINDYSDIIIVLVGNGVEKHRLLSRVEDEQINNVLMFDSVSKRSIPNLLRYFDCVYIGTRDLPLYRFGVGNNKFFDAMMAGKPVILSTNSHHTVIEDAGCGYVVPAEDTQGIVDAMIRMHNLTEKERAEIGSKGRKSVVGHYTYDTLADSFESLMGVENNKKSILYIEHYAGSESMGMEYRPFYLAKEWEKKGHRVNIFAADYSHLRNTNPTRKRDLDEEIIDGIHFHWIHTLKYKGNGIKRALSMIEFVGKIVIYSRQIIKKINPDVIITSSTYPLDTYAGQVLAGKRS